MPQFTKTGLGFVVEPQVRPFCGPLFFTNSLETPLGSITAAGSFGLVDTGTRRLLVTCHHVWDEFQTQHVQNSDLKMCVCLDRGNPIVFDTETLIDADKRLDLATFDMARLLSAYGPERFYPLKQKPAPVVKKGNVLFLIGFPGHLRQVVDGALGVGRTPYCVRTSSVDGLRFQSDVTNLKIKAEDYGGISGCPTFLVRDEDKPVQLVGFTTGTWMNLLFFTHARCLKIGRAHV